MTRVHVGTVSPSISFQGVEVSEEALVVWVGSGVRVVVWAVIRPSQRESCGDPCKSYVHVSGPSVKGGLNLIGQISLMGPCSVLLPF